MKKIILQLVISFILFGLFGCNQSSNNQPSTWKVEEKKILFDSDCLLPGSEILAELEGECAGNQFEPTDAAFDNSNQGRVSYVISSWPQFDHFKKKYFKAEYFKQISKDFFKENNLGVVFVIYTGSLFIHNEKLYCSKHRCGFSYEIWDRKMEAPPACVWTTLYIVKLKK